MVNMNLSFKLKLLLLTCLVFCIASATSKAGYIFGPLSEEFTYLGETKTKWEPGANTASVHTFSPPAGPMTPGGATWSIMGAGFSDASGFDSAAHGSNTTQAITSLGVTGFGIAQYAAVFDDALDVWADASGFTNLGQVTDGGVDAGASETSGGHLGDIRIAAWEITSAGVLAHAFQPGTEAFGTGGTIAGDVHFDVNQGWADDPTDTTADSDFDLFTVALHEFGHGLGLGHSSVAGSVMYPYYSGARRTLAADDIAGIRALYGVPEPCTITLLGIGILGMLGYGWRERRKQSSKEYELGR